MSTRTKEEYEQRGYDHARNGDVRSYKPDSTSWQGLAYNAGVQRYTAEKAQAIRPRGKSRMAEMLREAGYTPPSHQQPAKPIKVWFDELKHIDREALVTEVPVFSTEGWPAAAAEHVRKLTDDIYTETCEARCSRLKRSLLRMRDRYSKAPAGSYTLPKPSVWRPRATVTLWRYAPCRTPRYSTASTTPTAPSSPSTP